MHNENLEQRKINEGQERKVNKHNCRNTDKIKAEKNDTTWSFSVLSQKTTTTTKTDVILKFLLLKEAKITTMFRYIKFALSRSR